MTSSKNPVREFIEILRRIRTGHENLKVSSGIPGFIPGTGERVDAFSTALPWESATPDGLFTLKGDKPENPEGLGFAIEIFPQTGVTSEMEKTLIGLAAPLEAGSVLSITAFASSAVRGIAELMVPEARVPDGFPPLSLEAEGIIDTATNWAAENLVKGAVEQLTPQAPVYPRHWRVWLTVVVPTTKPDDEEVREKVLTARRAISAVLEQAGLFMGVWDADVLVGTASEILNPQLIRSGDFVRPSANPFEPPSVQVMKADTEVTVEKHRIRFETLDRKSAVHAVGLGVEHYGGHISLALTSQMLGELGRGGHQIPCPFLFTSIIAVLDSASERVKAEGHRMRALQMSHTPVSQISPWYPEKARQWTIAVNSFQTEGGIARVAHQYLLLAPAGLEAEAVHAAQSIARKAGMDVRRTTCLHAQALMGALPMCAGPLLVEDMKRSFRIQRRTLATGICGSPVMTEWQGTPIRDDRDRRTPLLTLVGRRGQIMHVDPFANASGNYSVTIVGKPGSGKSVVMNQLAFSCLAQGGLVCPMKRPARCSTGPFSSSTRSTSGISIPLRSSRPLRATTAPKGSNRWCRFWANSSRPAVLSPTSRGACSFSSRPRPLRWRRCREGLRPLPTSMRFLPNAPFTTGDLTTCACSSSPTSMVRSRAGSTARAVRSTSAVALRCSSSRTSPLTPRFVRQFL